MSCDFQKFLVGISNLDVPRWGTDFVPELTRYERLAHEFWRYLPIEDSEYAACSVRLYANKSVYLVDVACHYHDGIRGFQASASSLGAEKSTDGFLGGGACRISRTVGRGVGTSRLIRNRALENLLYNCNAGEPPYAFPGTPELVLASVLSHIAMKLRAFAFSSYNIWVFKVCGALISAAYMKKYLSSSVSQCRCRESLKRKIRTDVMALALKKGENPTSGGFNLVWVRSRGLITTIESQIRRFEEKLWVRRSRGCLFISLLGVHLMNNEKVRNYIQVSTKKCFNRILGE